MKKVSFILLLCVFSLGCSPDEPEPDINGFLETNKDVLYQSYNNTNTLRMPYCRFTNEKITPIEYWVDFVIWGEGCYSYYTVSYRSQYEITIDSETELQFTSNYTKSDGIEVLTIETFKIMGELLEIESMLYEDDVLINSNTSKWTKSSRNIDNLNMCDN